MANTEGIPKRQLGESDVDLLARGRVVQQWERYWAEPPRDYPVVRSFTVYPPKVRGDRWLVVLKGYGPDGEIVAFHKGQTIMGAVAGALRRVLSGKMGWKAETPYRPQRDR